MTASIPRPTRVLVTGASGFVGGALFRRLQADPSFEVVGLGRRPLADADYRAIDLAGPGAADALGALEFVPDVIVHAAARTSPWGSRVDFARDNVDTTRALLEFAGRGSAARRPRFVFVSTASVLYRAVDQVGVADDAPVGRRFVNGYAASKFTAEELVRGYAGEWVVLRPRAVFGPGDTTLFPRVIEAAERGRLPRFREGRRGPVLSDLVYIDTFVEQLVAALSEREAVGRTITVTNGEPVDLQRTVLTLLERLAVPTPTREVRRRAALWAATAVEAAWRLARRAGEPPVTRYSVIVYAYSKTFDPTLCRRVLGEPAVSVAEGLDRLVASLTREPA
ncbi:NAD-dependent epimerase/dehydratase family protein [Herbiconiux daphne]|uniref:NAD(P)-dependent oxidoreductase n=1 Tax=Herbiconiux daphne TaxID=2970914 RepID=A0ABT2H2K8_9MICO|nr:NAD(P)-dependent oxidoreductase [Herbiconiux daphne]MCS5734149.1 NAD(P)-dependent oxidoreductase [Herbiconiux daphne]